MALPQSNIDIIATQILVDAKQALVSLKNFNASVTDSRARIETLKGIIKSAAIQMGGDFKRAEASVRSFAGSLTGIKASEISQAGKELKQMGERGETAFQKLVQGAHFARIALGALVSMLLFQVLQAITSTFTAAINNLQEFEATLYRISNVERELSLKGIEISVAGLKKGVTEIKELLPIFSEEDIAQMIGSLAIATSHLGLAEDQILKLGKAFAILNVQSVEEETLLQTQAKIVNAIVTSQSKGIGNLGITFSKNRIEAEALNLGLLEIGETMADLSDAEKTQAKLAIVFDKAGIESSKEELAALQTYLESSDAKSQELKATWNDFLRDVGVQFAPLIIEFLQSAIDLVQQWTESLERNKPYWDFIVATLSGIQRIQRDINSENSDAGWLEKLVNKLVPTLGKLEDLKTKNIFKSFSDGFNDAMQKAENFGDATETATGDVKDLLSIDDEETLEALNDIDEKIQDIILDAQQAQEDLDLKLEQKTQDLDTEYIRKGEDAAIDHADKLEDINQDALDKIEDAKRKSREDEEKAERDLLQKLKELRQRFLMDLEDALHERDARQVLRLIREYKFDKQNILDKKKLEDQERKESLQADLEAIEIERRRRIESENIEYQRKLADLAQAKQREQEELALWYAREQEDIARNVEQKLEKLLAGYIAEGKIHEDQQAAIYATLVKYFGKDMALVDSLAQFMAQRFAQINSMAGSLGSGYRPLDLGSIGSRSPGRTDSRSGFAEGGSVIATKPTRAIFGERGAELATFTPLGRTGKDVNKLFGDVSGTGGANGMAKVLLSLSPDLEAKILDDAMSGVALTIERVRREKR